jgi:hypothetical protein
MGVQRRPTRPGGGTPLSPASPVAKTFTPQFPDPSPLAVFSRLPMALGRAMVAANLLRRLCKLPSRSKRSSPIESSRAIPASPIGHHHGAVGLVGKRESLFRSLLRRLRSPKQEIPRTGFPLRRLLNDPLLWGESHLNLVPLLPDLEPTWFEEETPSVGWLETIGEPYGSSTEPPLEITQTESTQDSDSVSPRSLRLVVNNRDLP